MVAKEKRDRRRKEKKKPRISYSSIKHWQICVDVRGGFQQPWPNKIQSRSIYKLNVKMLHIFKAYLYLAHCQTKLKTMKYKQTELKPKPKRAPTSNRNRNVHTMNFTLHNFTTSKKWPHMAIKSNWIIYK